MLFYHSDNVLASRRAFLGAVGAGAALALSPTSLTAARKSKSALAGDDQADKVFRRLQGPMASITIPYQRDFSVDHGSLRNWVDFMCENKAPILFFTYGDGEIYNLGEEEVEAVIRTVAAQAKGRALVVGGTPHGWSGRTVQFINRCADSGVDAMNVHLQSSNEGEIYRALSEICEKTSLPLLAYESKWSVDLVERISKLPRMIGMKCHAELYRYYDFIRATKDNQFGVHSAGQMKHFLFGHLIGSPAYLCPLTPFAPQIGLKFYHALKNGEVETARQVIFDYEEPLLKQTIPLGYPQAYKSAIYLTGHYKTNLVRPPKKTNTEEEIQPLRRFLQSKGLRE